MSTPTKSPFRAAFQTVRAKIQHVGELAFAERVEQSEISKEQIDSVQRKIDAKLEKGLTFTTVKRASW